MWNLCEKTHDLGKAKYIMDIIKFTLLAVINPCGLKNHLSACHKNCTTRF